MPIESVVAANKLIHEVDVTRSHIEIAPFSGQVTDSREDFVAELEKQRDAVNAAADNAPDEISDDAQTVAEWFAELSDALAAVDPTDQAALEEAGVPFEEDDPEVVAAGESVGEFALTECGIDLDESG